MPTPSHRFRLLLLRLDDRAEQATFESDAPADVRVIDRFQDHAGNFERRLALCDDPRLLAQALRYLRGILSLHSYFHGGERSGLPGGER